MNEQEMFNEAVENLEENLMNSSLIQDNKLLFPIGTKLYRVRMPNQSEQSQAETYRNKKYLELISSGSCTTEVKLIEMLKTSGVADVEELRNEKRKITKELEAIYVNLAVRYSSEEKTIEKFKVEAEALKNKLRNLSVAISELLIPSIETQIEKAYLEKITSLCTEKCVAENKWEAKWSSFEEFQKDDPKITDIATTYITWLLLNSKA